MCETVKHEITMNMTGSFHDLQTRIAQLESENARLRADIECMKKCPPYDPCRNDNCLDEKEVAETVIANLRAELAAVKPKSKVVCLCGSTRFREDFIRVTREETLKGNIVLSVGLFGHLEGLDMEGEVKRNLDELHLRKIDMADEVIIIAPGGYIGESTGREKAYAEAHGKPITMRPLPEPEE